jgi:predicted DNA-binding antitoxin AbrB/MazE fold protein
MSKVVEAEYLAEQGVLKLARPLDGIADHERVHVVIEQSPSGQRNDWPTLDEEAGRELAGAVRDAFGRDEIAI